MERPSYARSTSFGGLESTEARSAKVEAQSGALIVLPDFTSFHPGYEKDKGSGTVENVFSGAVASPSRPASYAVALSIPAIPTAL
jgi:hypothetical protein